MQVVIPLLLEPGNDEMSCIKGFCSSPVAVCLDEISGHSSAAKASQDAAAVTQRVLFRVGGVPD